MKFFFLFIVGILCNHSLISKNKGSDDRTIAYLGIYATKVNPNVSHQLMLTENLYLNVERVEKNSPAEKAGIQKFDLLLQLNDQILVNQEQLKYLVRSKMPTDVVTLTLLRQGKKQKITLKLGEANLTEENSRQNSTLGNRFPLDDPFDMDRFFDNPRNIRDLIDRHSIQPYLHFNQNRGRHKKILPPAQLDDEPLHPKTNIESFSSQTSQSQIMIPDADGTLEWTEKDGQKYLRVLDSLGKVLFDGPINTDEERNSLPNDVSERLKELENNMRDR